MLVSTLNLDDYNKFEAKVRSFALELGLGDWVVETRFEVIDDGIASRCHFDMETRKAMILLSPSVTYDYGHDGNVETIAKHEILHLVLADAIHAAAQIQNADHSLVIGAEHGAIMRLLRVIN